MRKKKSELSFISMLDAGNLYNENIKKYSPFICDYFSTTIDTELFYEAAYIMNAKAPLLRNEEDLKELFDMYFIPNLMHISDF